MISIIITTYNYAHMLPMAVDSACLQDYPHLEILVLDNASTDDTVNVMARYRDDPRIIYHRNVRNIGQVANHNLGVARAKGEYIVFLSADDIILPGHLSTLYAYLQSHPDIDIVFTPLYSMNLAGHITARRRSELKTTYAGERNELAGMLAFGCDMCLPTMLVPRRIYLDYGPFDEQFTSWDYEIFVRWAAKGVSFAYTAEPMAAFRSHLAQQTSAPNYMRTGKISREHLKILKRNVIPEHAERLRGYEASIARLSERRYKQAVVEGFLDGEDLRGEVLAMSVQLEELQTFNNSKPFHPALNVVVLANDNLFELELSLRSLVGQSYQDWNAFVISQPSMPLQSFCTLIDPRGRIKAFTMLSPGSEGDALNTAMCISAANCFAFMRAGTQFSEDHLAMIIDNFRMNDCDVTISPANIHVHDGNGRVETIHDGFPDQSQFPAMSCAPCFPLESIALKRRAVDRCYYFNEDIKHVIEWDLLVRLQLYANCRFIDSPVSLQVELDKPYPFSDIQAVAEISQLVYSYFKSTDPALSHLRHLYTQDVQKLQREISHPSSDFSTIRHVYRTLSGANTFEMATPELAALS